MKRDPDLSRRILKAVEDLPAGVGTRNFVFDGYNHLEIHCHVALLIEDGYLAGSSNKPTRDFPGEVWVDRLTPKGHQFLEAARDDTLWAKGKQVILSKGGVWTFDILKDVLTQLVRAQLNLQ